MDPFLPAVGELSGRITPSFSSFLSSTLTEVIPATYVTVRGPAAYEFGHSDSPFQRHPAASTPAPADRRAVASALRGHKTMTADEVHRLCIPPAGDEGTIRGSCARTGDAVSQD